MVIVAGDCLGGGSASSASSDEPERSRLHQF